MQAPPENFVSSFLGYVTYLKLLSSKPLNFKLLNLKKACVQNILGKFSDLVLLHF